MQAKLHSHKLLSLSSESFHVPYPGCHYPDLSDPPSQTLKNVNIFCALNISNKMHLWVVLLSCHYILFYLIHVLTIPKAIMKEKYMYMSLGNVVCVCVYIYIYIYIFIYTKHSIMLIIHSMAISKHSEN